MSRLKSASATLSLILQIALLFNFSLTINAQTAQPATPQSSTQKTETPPAPRDEIKQGEIKQVETILPSQIVTNPDADSQDLDEDDVVRITTRLVQVDVIVTDKQGNQVTDLRQDEIQVFENGKPQPITNFSFISNVADAETTTEAKPNVKDKSYVPPPSRTLKANQVQRTIALVVDDLGLSFESSYYVRESLKKFVNEQMQPGDLVAIIRTRSGMGALQQFTSNKPQLLAAIERVRWFPSGRGGVGAFAPIESDPLAQAQQSANARSGGNGNQSSNDDDDIQRRNSAREDPDDFRNDSFAVGSLGALNYVVRGLQELPGRKSVIFMSDGFRLFREGEQNIRVLNAVRRLVDYSNRAAVTIYTIDPRGLQTLGLTAADDTSGRTAEDVRGEIDNRRDELFETQNGMEYLARETGGFLIKNTNDLGRGVRRVLRDQAGYYLVGYRPDEATFNPVSGKRKFNRFQVKVTRPGVTVRARSGFFGVTDDEIKQTQPTTPIGQLAQALSSPFAKAGVELRLMSVFADDKQGGSFIRSFLHINTAGLSFKTLADGAKSSTLDILAVTFDQDGKPIEEINKTGNLEIRGATFARVQREGLVYVMNLPVKKPGAYQLRVAVRDAATQKTGSANQFIEVPNLKKDRLALSGLIVTLTPPETAKPQNVSLNASNNSDEEAAAQYERDSQTATAMRRFKSNGKIDFGLEIYNARLDKQTRQPNIETQTRLFHDNKMIYEGKRTPLNAARQTDIERLNYMGRLQLGSNLAPGDYVLQIIVTDINAKEKNRIKTQAVDFEIVK